MRIIAALLVFQAQSFAQTAAQNPPLAMPSALDSLGGLRSSVTAYFSMDSTTRGGLAWSRGALAPQANDKVVAKEKDGRKYLDFSRSGSRVRMEPEYNTGEKYTLTAWVKVPQGDGAFNGVVWHGASGLHMMVSNSSLGYYTGGKGFSWDASAKGYSGWHHVAVTCNGTKSQAFWDGRPLGVHDGRVSGSVVAIGNHPTQQHEHWMMSGGIDEQIFFDRALAPVEIATVMQATKAKEVPVAAAPPGAPKTAAGLVSEFSGNLVFVADQKTGGAGSGFICEHGGEPALFTNTHVVAGMGAPVFKRLDNSIAATLGAPASAVGHDIMRYRLPPEVPMPKLRAAPDVGAIAAIGDEIFVLGNSEGARVIAPLTGTIAGLGPELIEVTAEFVPGNSGSPIIHAKTGFVIGIATYLTVRDQKFLSGESKNARVRRFGYRLDSVKQWQSVDWAVFERERLEVKKAEQLTTDLTRLLHDMKDGTITFSAHKNPAIARHVQAFQDKVSSSSRINATDHAAAVSMFLKFMKSVSQQDITDANNRLRYDYFRRAIAEEKQVRTLFAEIFDKLVKQLK